MLGRYFGGSRKRGGRAGAESGLLLLLSRRGGRAQAPIPVHVGNPGSLKSIPVEAPPSPFHQIRRRAAMKTTLNGMAAVGLFAVVLLSACAPTRMAVGPSLWNQKEAHVGVAIVAYPESAAHKVGAQGLLDIAINTGLASELKAHLLTLKPDEFDAIRDRFTAELRTRGLQAKAVLSPVNLDTYGKFAKPAGGSGEFFEKDLKTLAETESVDLLVLLSVTRFGTIRSYYGFIPLGAPQGFCQTSGQLIDLRSNQLIWRTTEPEHESMVGTDGPWDQAPHYPNLTTAIKRAVVNAQEFLFKDFFGAASP
jgi:hypothetical protein